MAEKSLTIADYQRVLRRVADTWQRWMDCEGMLPEPEFDNFMSACATAHKLTQRAKVNSGDTCAQTDAAPSD